MPSRDWWSWGLKGVISPTWPIGSMPQLVTRRSIDPTNGNNLLAGKVGSNLAWWAAAGQ